MTGKQRALAAIAGKPTDRPSVLPSIDVAYAPACIGETVGACFRDPTLHARALMGALDNYPDIDRYLDEVVKDAERDGYTTTAFGRRRYIPEINSQNGNLRAFGRRVAMNAPIQGTAADIMKLAMLRVDSALKEAGLDARIVMQVHDELVIEVRDDQIDRCRELLRSAMESAAELTVPLTVDVTVGKNWLDQE